MSSNRERSFLWLGIGAGLLVVAAIVAFVRMQPPSSIAHEGRVAGAREMEVENGELGAADTPLRSDAASESTKDHGDGRRELLPPEPRVAGRVVDESDKPVRGARCQLRRPRADAQGDDARSLAAFSDSEGRFAIEPDGDPSESALVVTRYGRASARVELPRGAAREELFVRLLSTPPIVGCVLWPNGKPAENAQVFIDDGELPSGISVSEVTGAQGRFEFRELGDGPFSIHVRAPRVRQRGGRTWSPDGIDDDACIAALVIPVRVARPVPELTLTLRSDLGLRGRVVDERGTPWTRYRVAAVPVFAGDELGSTSHQVGRNITADDGAFELRGLPEGVWRVSASAGTASTSAQRIELHRGVVPDTVELTLARGARVSGSVLDAHERPVRGASVHLCAKDAGASWLTSARGCEVRSDAKGRFEFVHIEPTPARVQLVACSDTSCSEVATLAIDDATALDDLVLRMPPEGTLRVSVSGVSGPPTADSAVFDDTARVELCWMPMDLSGWNGLATEPGTVIEPAQRLIRRTLCGRDTFTSGKGTRIDLAVGTYFVRASCGDLVSAVQRVSLIANTECDVPLKLEPGVLLRPYTSEHTPIPLELDVRVLDEAGNPATLASPDDARSMERILVPPGHYRVEARARDGRHAERDVDATKSPDQGSLGVELELRP